MNKCSKKNCNNAGTSKVAKHGNKTYYYCDKHVRFRRMADKSNKRYGSKLTIQDIEDLYDSIYLNDNPTCFQCGKKMNWRPDIKRSNIITIQHWENGILGFLCHSCNARHGSSTNPNVFNILLDKKWCPKCRQEKDKGDFTKNKNGTNGLEWKCKECRKIHRKN